jgi:predicted GNAT superfamily acetyltransferase
VGTQVAFLGRTDGDLALHSHVTGVLPGRQHAGIGFALKLAQRSWALDHGIETVTWTFDPLIARNAHFNLRKLGARAERFFRDFYGDMPDAINAGERSDRLEIVWRLLDPRAQAAARGAATPVPDESAQPLLESEEGRPVLREASGPQLLIHVPSDYTTLRKRDPRLADDWREAVAGAFERAFKGGLLAVDFRREDSSYLLDRP